MHQEVWIEAEPWKCCLFQTEVPFLGKLVSRQGVSIDPNKIKAIIDWPVPKSKKDVESFLGFMNYHQDHIKDFADITVCLYELIGPKNHFNWTQEHQTSFEKLRECLVCAPILAYPNSTDKFIIDTDALDKAIGAELIQVQDGEEKVVCYGSYSLTPSQRNYCTTCKELLAVVRFCREYHHYSLGRSFIVHTDHSSLTWLMRFKHVEGQQAQWLEELSQFDMTIQHQAGCKHSNADGLSRIPEEDYCNCYEAGVHLADLLCGGCKFFTRVHENWKHFESDVNDVVPLAVRTVHIADDADVQSASSSTDVGPTKDVDEQSTSWLPQYTPEQLWEKQVADQDLGKLIIWLEDKVTPTTQDLYLSSQGVKRFWFNKNLLTFKNKVLYYTWEDYPFSQQLLMVPESLREQVLQGCHDCPTSGHLGQQKTYDRVKRSFMWHEMSTDVTLYVKTCTICSKNKKPRIKPKAQLGSYHAGARMERVHLDMMGPLPESDKGNKYIMVMVDQFSKWVEIQPLAEISAETTARAAIDNFFSRFGYPLLIHTDQDKNFDGNLFQQMCSLLQITKTRTTPYRPCSNGQVERYNHLLLQLIRCYISTRQSAWDEDLQLLTGAIRAMKNRSTGYSANMMILLMDTFQPVDILMGTEGATLHDEDPSTYLKKLHKTLQEVHQLAREHLHTGLCYQKKTYDLKLQESHFEVGNLVYRLNAVSKKG